MLVAARRDEGLPRWLSGEESAFQGKRHGFNPWVGKIPWVGNGNLLQPEKLLGQRSLVSYSPWGGKESDTTEPLSPHRRDVSGGTLLYPSAFHPWGL